MPLKQYLMDVSKAYSEYRRTCKKNGEKECIAYFALLPLYPIVERWLAEIQKELDAPYLSEKIRTQRIKNTTVLFRDRFAFYNFKIKKISANVKKKLDITIKYHMQV